MKRFPQELQDHVFQYLPVSDVASVVKACLKESGSGGHPQQADGITTTQLRDAVNNRLDPATHFRRSFCNVKQLVRCLSRTGTVLIGPRAFQYFSAEDCPHHDGAWDFLAQWFPADILDVLLSLSKAGVVWEAPLERASRQVRGCIACQETIRNSALETARSGEVLDMTAALGALSRCRVHERQGILTSVQGIARDGRTPVILHIQEPNEGEFGTNVLTAPFRHLCDVRISHLQCMLTGYTAIHMNFAATKRKEAVILLQGMDSSPDESLIPDGYRLEERTGSHGTLRTLADGGSLRINLSRFSEIDTKVAENAHVIVGDAVWYEFAKETHHVPNLVDYAAASRNFDFIDHFWGQFTLENVPVLVGESCHNFDPFESFLILKSDYGVASDWVWDGSE